MYGIFLDEKLLTVRRTPAEIDFVLKGLIKYHGCLPFVLRALTEDEITRCMPR